MTTPEELDALQEARRLLAEAEMAKATLHPGSVADRLADTTIFFANEVIRLRARVAELEAEVTGYREWGADVKRLTRQIDVEMHGEEGAAKQASLCDLVGAGKDLRDRAEAAEAELARRGQGVQVNDLAMAIAVDMEVHTAISTTTKAKAEAIAARIRAALVSPGDGLSEYEKKVAQMKEDFPNGI